MSKQILKGLVYASLLFGITQLSYAATSVDTTFTLNASVQGGVNIYCNGVAPGSGGSCGVVQFPQYTGVTQPAKTVTATVTSNDPLDDATLTVADSAGGNYALKLPGTLSQQIPLAVEYTDCTGNHYGSTTSNNVLISNADITGSSISGDTPACTSYNVPNPSSGTYGTFTFTLLGEPSLPQNGNYTETLNINVGSV